MPTNVVAGARAQLKVASNEWGFISTFNLSLYFLRCGSKHGTAACVTLPLELTYCRSISGFHLFHQHTLIIADRVGSTQTKPLNGIESEPRQHMRLMLTSTLPIPTLSIRLRHPFLTQSRGEPGHHTRWSNQIIAILLTEYLPTHMVPRHNFVEALFIVPLRCSTSVVVESKVCFVTEQPPPKIWLCLGSDPL